MLRLAKPLALIYQLREKPYQARGYGTDCTPVLYLQTIRLNEELIVIMAYNFELYDYRLFIYSPPVSPLPQCLYTGLSHTLFLVLSLASLFLVLPL